MTQTALDSLVHRFNELVAEVGFGFAVVIMENALSSDYFERFNWKEWKQIFLEAPRGSHLKNRAAQYLSKLADTFEEYINTLILIPEDSSWCEELDIKLQSLGNFCEWQDVIDNCPTKNVLRVAKKRMLKIGAFENWYEFYNRYSGTNPFESFTLTAMIESARNFGQCNQVYCLVRDEALQQNILQRMIDLASSFDDWKFILKNSSAKSKIQEISLNKVREFSLEFFKKKRE